MLTEWRVSWEVVTPFVRADLFPNGKFAGPMSEIEEKDWHPVERVSNDEKSVREQYITLARWEDEQTEPIRKTRLQSREPGPWTVVHA